MLQVFFLILKIIGIILAAALGLVLLVLLLVLFVPVRYRACGVKKGAECRAEAKISWLLHLISVPVIFRDGELSIKIKIFGFTLMDLSKGDSPDISDTLDASGPERRSAAENPAPDREPEPQAGGQAEQRKEEQTGPLAGQSERGEQSEPQPEEKTAAGPDLPEQDEKEEEEEEEEEEGVFSRFLQFLKAVWNFLLEIPRKLKNLKCTFQRFCGKIKRMVRKYQEVRAFALDERTKAALRLVLEQAKLFARQALPRKVRGEVRFGTSDPALTGQILGAAGIFYPLFMDNVKVYPDFEQSVLEGELFLKGRLRMVSVARIAWRLFRDKNIRYVYRKLNRQQGI